jgi:hypothetical protein
MDDIEKSISSGSAGFEPPIKKKSPVGAIILIVIAIAVYAASNFIPSGPEIVEGQAATVTPENEGKLVHITGELNVPDLNDPLFDISAKAILLERIVQMYQWTQDGDKYGRKWEDKVIAITGDDARIKGLVNPSEMPFSSDKWETTDVKIGAFTLSPELIKQLPAAQDMPLTQENFDKMPEEGKMAFKLSKGIYFFGLNPDAPRIGEVKVSYKKIDAGLVSIIAKQQGNTLVQLQSDKGTIGKLVPGSYDIASMAETMETSSTPYIQYAALGTSGILFLIGLVNLLKSIKLPTREKREKQPADQLEEEHQAEEDNEFLEDEEHFPEEPEIPEEESSDDLIEEFEPPQVLEIPMPPPPPLSSENQHLEFAPNQIEETDEMPAGIEMIGPDTYATEEVSHDNLPVFEQEYADEPLADSSEEDDSDELPPGIEMIGPDTIQSPQPEMTHNENLEPWEKFASMEYPPQPEDQPTEEADETSGGNFELPPEEPQYQTGDLSSGLEFVAGNYVPSEPALTPEETSTFSDYELSAVPSEFSGNAEAPELQTATLETPSQLHEPLEFTEEDPADDYFEAEETNYTPESTGYVPPQEDAAPEPLNYTAEEEFAPEPIDYPPEPAEESEADSTPFDPNYLTPEFEYQEDEEDESSSAPMPIVPPLPLPDFLKESSRATSATSFAPEEPEMNEPAQPIGTDDIFSSLLSSIPDDFDPTAEMEPPQKPASNTEEGEGDFDPFANEDDSDFSPFAVHEEENK